MFIYWKVSCITSKTPRSCKFTLIRSVLFKTRPNNNQNWKSEAGLPSCNWRTVPTFPVAHEPRALLLLGRCARQMLCRCEHGVFTSITRILLLLWAVLLGKESDITSLMIETGIVFKTLDRNTIFTRLIAQEDFVAVLDCFTKTEEISENWLSSTFYFHETVYGTNPKWNSC